MLQKPNNWVNRFDLSQEDLFWNPFHEAFFVNDWPEDFALTNKTCSFFVGRIDLGMWQLINNCHTFFHEWRKCRSQVIDNVIDFTGISNNIRKIVRSKNNNITLLGIRNYPSGMTDIASTFTGSTIVKSATTN